MARYIALLRGINVGGNHKVEMPRLKALLLSMGYAQATTYLHSGNAMFVSGKAPDTVRQELTAALEAAFGFEIPTLIRTDAQMRATAEAIPAHWQNDAAQKTDIAFLFPPADAPEVLDTLPLNREYADVRYVPGAVIWHIDRENYNKSRLNRIIGTAIYRQMTVRNVNTVRVLAEYPWDGNA
ncbi:MAG TPA: DUF1697 domain-containing protein [Candidatus Limiplasma sp.]|nr:DUF1697 domain-containing protein [Candidatus Limiplasma sp.]HRX08271.1 DUF1697 domain-containing protein [Candidatus Limiplasma sp.]